MNIRRQCCQRKRRAGQGGAAIVEFALVSTVFFTLLIGIMELGRVLYYWNAATEATRLGARVAVVCDIGSTKVRSRMESMLPILADTNIQVQYSPAGCDIDSCLSVTVSILPGKTVTTLIPFVPMSFSLPTFSTTLPRESLNSTSNPVCG